MWGECATRTRTKKGQPTTGYPWCRSGLLVEPTTEAVFHPAGERSARTLGALLARRAGIRAGTVTTACHPWTGDGEDHTAEHHQEAEHRQNRETANHRGLERHTANQHGQPDHKKRGPLEAAPCRGRSQSPTPNARRELGVLGIERALDLVEHALLMIGELHSALLAGPAV